MSAEDAELELGFDPTLKKKKKKDKTESAPADEAAEELDDLELDLGAKKKKKKKKAVAEDANDLDDDLSLDLGLSKKKKKKKKEKKVEEEEEEVGAAEGADSDDSDDEREEKKAYPWEGSSRDYNYEELLDRVFGIIRTANPELGGKRRTILKPPQVLREGTKKTVFVNFVDLCKAMHRTEDHVMQYLLVELGTTGSLDGQKRLIVKGRFMPKVFEGILRRYVNEYCLCSMCKSTDTVLSKKDRLTFVACNSCGASRSVQAVKAGFVAQVGRRPRK